MLTLTLCLMSALSAEDAISSSISSDPGPDARLTRVRDTDTVFEMGVFTERHGWEAYAEDLRRRILVACGLWPRQDRAPVNARITGRIYRDDYIIENVYIEAFPGYYVTGNVYRPVGDGPFPAVACPHGHWERGRFEDGERGSVPARAITFARMGIVAFTYDMVGHNDSLQMPFEWAHRPEGVPESQRRLEALWGFHPFALQLVGGLYVVDYLESLACVDPERIGCTGASGGGTQTFILTAVDPRIKVAAPVNMISHTMQGGCVCENAPLIRRDASNMEISALAAPRPMLMVSATGDWTRDTPAVEYPAIRSVYALYGASNLLETHQEDADHNYNRASREAVYRFFGAHLLGEPEKYAHFTEPPYAVEPVETLRVFPDARLPEGALSADGVRATFIARVRENWSRILPTSPDAVEAFRETAAPAFADAVGAAPPDPSEVEVVTRALVPEDVLAGERIVLTRAGQGERVELRMIFRTTPESGPVTLLVRDGVVDAEPLIQALQREGHTVAVLTPFLAGQPDARTYGAFPDTFMPTNAGYRVQDILTALAWLRTRYPKPIYAAGLGEAGLWTLFAAALDPQLAGAFIDMNQFPIDDDAAWVERHYIPCIRAVGDVPTALALVAPRPLWLAHLPYGFDRDACAAPFSDGRIRFTQTALSADGIVAAMADLARTPAE